MTACLPRCPDRLVLVAAGALCAVLLFGCGSRPVANHAPVEDRSTAVPTTSAPVTDPRTAAVKPAPGFENVGKPGYYTVKPGDTLIRISMDNGQSPKDLARWNALENPNRIEVGQVLRVIPPLTGDTVVAVSKPVASASVAVTPMASASVPVPVAGASAPAAPAVSASAPVVTPVAGAVSASAEEDMGWVWPGKGSVIAGFDDVKNKGVDIGGAAGDAVLAAADGRVVYAGDGLRGYGNLIILKHNNTYLTAYAHNQALMVKEDQTVKKGQKIAEMGSSGTDRVKLHFEVRRQGKPVDPAKYLPAR